MHNFRTYQVAIELYRATRTLKLPRQLRDQLDRASSSVVLNLAEGWSKSSRKDRRDCHPEQSEGSTQKILRFAQNDLKSDHGSPFSDHVVLQKILRFAQNDLKSDHGSPFTDHGQIK